MHYIYTYIGLLAITVIYTILEHESIGMFEHRPMYPARCAPRNYARCIQYIYSTPLANDAIVL